MYIVTEIQTNTDGTVSILNSTYEDRNQAESKYHTVLAHAAVSNLPVHSATMCTEEGFPLLNACYKHEVQPEPEPVIEPTDEEGTDESR